MCNGTRYSLSCTRSAIDGKYHVQSINFDRKGNNLSGALSASLYTLPKLESIYMAGNPHLVVNIDDLAQSIYASNYKAINVLNSTMYGTINNLSSLNNLEYLDVSCNSWNGGVLDNCTVVGDTSFVPSLSKLYALNIGGNT